MSEARARLAAKAQPRTELRRRRQALARATRPRSGAARQPLDWQQAHSRTVAVEVVESRRLVPDGAGGVAAVAVTARRTQRRLLDARLWGGLQPAEQAAAERLYAGFCLITRGLGARGSALDRIRVDGGGAPDGEGQQRLLRDYARWCRACRAEGLDRRLVLAVLAEGRRCADLDRERRQRKGGAAATLKAGLALFCRLKGWG